MKQIYRFFLATFVICSSVMFYSCDCDMDCGCGCKDCPDCNDNCCTDCRRSTVTASFAKNSLAINIGETKEQKVTTNCPDAEIVYKSSVPSVASVDHTTGKVTGLRKGSATITATVKAPKASKKFEGECTVSYQVDVDYASLGTVSMHYGASFSPDFLELITPILTYRDQEGDHEIRLDKQVCEHRRTEYPIDDEVLVFEDYGWSSDIVCKMFENEEFDETISMRFESNQTTIDPTRQYDLSVGAGVPSVQNNFFYNGTYYLNSYRHWSISLDINIGDGESHDDDIYEGEAVQKYIDAIVQRKLDNRVEVSKDGKIKVNGE